MDMELCMQFRDKVNENDLVYHIYRNRDGKDQWSIIFSAMDWIEVVADSIDSSALSLKNDNASSVKLMTFVVCIDVLWEAVQQLHRVFVDAKTIPFKDDDSVFIKKQFPMKDNQYFKTIRACFATHPINLNDHFTDDKQKEQRYAGWSSGGLGDGDFSVPLYSNIPGEEAIFFDIRISELMGFAQKRYEYLKEIIKEIDNKVNEYLNCWRCKEIERSDSIIEQIEILIREEKDRYDNDYLKYALKKLRIIFSTNIKSPKNQAIVEKYRSVMRVRLDEIFDILQTMQLEDLPSDKYIDDSPPSKYQYPFSKLCEMIYGGAYNHFALSMLEDGLGDVIDFVNITIDEIYVTLCAQFYEMNRTKSPVLKIGRVFHTQKLPP